MKKALGIATLMIASAMQSGGYAADSKSMRENIEPVPAGVNTNKGWNPLKPAQDLIKRQVMEMMAKREIDRRVKRITNQEINRKAAEMGTDVDLAFTELVVETVLRTRREFGLPTK